MNDMDFKNEENNDLNLEGEIDDENKENKGQFAKKEIFTQEKDKTLEQIYTENDFQKIQRPPKIPIRILITSIIISIIFGLLAGFFGSLFLLTRREINLPFFKKVNFENILPKREITLVTEKKISVVPEERIIDLQNKLKKEVVQVFFSKKIEKDNFLNKTLLPWEILGTGIIFTSDGWIITTKNTVNFRNGNYSILTSDRKIYLVKKIFFDNLTNIVFLKVEANDLPVINFSDGENKEGKTLLIFNKFLELNINEISFSYFSKILSQESFINSTEKISQFIKISKTIDEKFIGAPAFDLDGGLVGFVLPEKDQLLSTDYFKSLSFNFLKKELITRSFLGLEYIFLEDLIDVDRSDGVLVWRVLTKSPAENTGLKKGDLILKINDIPISKNNNPTKIIQEKNPEEEVYFLVLRKGKEITLKTKLSKL